MIDPLRPELARAQAMKLRWKIAEDPHAHCGGAKTARPKTEKTEADALAFSGHRKPVKIIASLGPASRPPGVMKDMILAGVDVFRIDFSRGTPAEHGRSIRQLREISEHLRQSQLIRKPVAVMADLQGPRIAVDKLATPIELIRGERVRLCGPMTPHKPVQNSSPSHLVESPVIPTTYPELMASLRPGNTLIIDDGRVVLEVVESASASNNGMAVCRTAKGGKVNSGLGINAPDAPLKTPALTAKDLADLQFALDQGIEIITQSYPASAEDVAETRRRIDAHDRKTGRKTMLIAKIERPQAVQEEALAAIARVADGLMVARGDLGTEMGVENLPRLQERIIRAARREGKIAIVANKLLGTMIDRDQPGRSDVFDMVQAIRGGAHMVMLTGETAAGRYPVQAIALTNRLIRKYSAPQQEDQTPPRHPADNLQTMFLSLLSGIGNLLRHFLSRLTSTLRELFHAGIQQSRKTL